MYSDKACKLTSISSNCMQYSRNEFRFVSYSWTLDQLEIKIKFKKLKKKMKDQVQWNFDPCDTNTFSIDK